MSTKLINDFNFSEMEPSAGSVRSPSPSNMLTINDPRLIAVVAVSCIVIVSIVIFIIYLIRCYKKQDLPQKPIKRVIIMKAVRDFNVTYFVTFIIIFAFN